MESQLIGQHPPWDTCQTIQGKRPKSDAHSNLHTVWQYAGDVALKTLLEKMATYCYQRGLTINYDKSHLHIPIH